MWQIVIVALVHTSILFVVLFGLRRLDRYTSYKFSRFDVHCPTKLAGKGQYEAPPRGQAVLWLVIHLIIPRLILISAIVGPFLILLYDFGFRAKISSWFDQPGWEWKLPIALVIAVAINLVVTLERLCSRRLSEPLPIRKRQWRRRNR
jgi:hypothetical protein